MQFLAKSEMISGGFLVVDASGLRSDSDGFPLLRTEILKGNSYNSCDSILGYLFWIFWIVSFWLQIQMYSCWAIFVGLASGVCCG